MPTRRNPVVRAGALLRKGGVHRQSASGHRHQGKRALDDEIDDWFEGECDAVESADVQDRCCERVESASGKKHLKRRKGWDGSAPGGMILTNIKRYMPYVEGRSFSGTCSHLLR